MDSDDEVPELVSLSQNVDLERYREHTLSSVRQPVPLVVITGQLGAGKTTFLTQLLKCDHGRKIGVILNELSEGTISENLLILGNNEKRYEEWIEVRNGCFCCSVKGIGLQKIEALLRKNMSIDLLILETTGIADPGPLIKSFWVDEELQSEVILDGIITIVDSNYIEKQLISDSNLDPGNVASNQIAFADILLLNKTDLISANKLKNLKLKLSQINGNAEIISCQRCRFDAEKIFKGIHAYDIKNDFMMQRIQDAETERNSIVHIEKGSIDIEKFELNLQKLLWEKNIRNKSGIPLEVLRLKGILSVSNLPKKMMVQSIIEMYDISATVPWLQTEKRICKLLIIVIMNNDNISTNNSKFSQSYNFNFGESFKLPQINSSIFGQKLYSAKPTSSFSGASNFCQHNTSDDSGTSSFSSTRECLMPAATEVHSSFVDKIFDMSKELTNTTKTSDFDLLSKEQCSAIASHKLASKKSEIKTKKKYVEVSNLPLEVLSSKQKSFPSGSRRADNTATEAHLSNSYISPEITKIKSVLCKNVPVEINCQETLWEHFQQFGKIDKIICNSIKNRAVIHFEKHEGAAKAKKYGKELKLNGGSIHVVWNYSVSHGVKLLSYENHNLIDFDNKTNAESNVANYDSLKTEILHSDLIRDMNPNKDTKICEIKLEKPIHLLTKPAITAGERYLVLDYRDRILRLEMNKVRDVKKAMIIQGTCPDMCPEKERYMREEKHRISIFEQHKNSDKYQANHSFCVKEYSRSSADQEEPLPHELRPTPVLIKTMYYLLYEIANHFDYLHESIYDWYNFLWDRTRSIRKDITQQQLCDLDVVNLVERCARFHIHCAACLCEEDVTCFDPKINHENLLKCLQTLKHMYYDLSLHHIYCPNEAEFRAYDVILQLFDGDVLRQIQHLRFEIRTSNEVQFSIQVFNAINNNNFVRFFKEVHRSTYLQACILHRYFPQVRSVALHILFKAYCPGGKKEYPIFKLVQLLGFESKLECVQFCESFGLTVNEDNVILEKQVLASVPFGWNQIRSRTIVERKRNHLLGHILWKEPCSYNNYTFDEPHNSFDEYNILKPEAYQAKDQQGQLHNITQTKNFQNLNNIPAIILDVDSMASKFLTEMIDIEIKSVCSDIMSQYFFFQKFVNETIDQLFIDCLHSLLKDLCEESCTKKCETGKFEQIGVLKSIVENVLYEEIDEYCYELVGNLIQMFNLLLSFSNLIFNSLINELIIEICEEIFYHEHQQKRNKFQIMQAIGYKLDLSSFFLKWKLIITKKKNFYNLICSFPATASCLTLEEQNLKLGWNVENIYQPYKPYDSKLQMNNKRLIQIAECQASFKKKFKYGPIPLIQLLSPIFKKQFKHKHIYWKLIIIKMNENDDLLWDWLCNKFSPCGKWKSEISNFYSDVIDNGKVLSVCIRKIIGIPQKNEIKGASAAILFCNNSLFLEDKTYVLQNIPFALLMRELPINKILLNKSQWTEILDEDKNNEAFNFIKLCKTVQHLAVNSNPQPYLEPFYLYDLIERFMYDEVVTLFSEDSKQTFNVLLLYFNLALKHLAEIISDPDLTLIDWPPPEFGNQPDLPPENWNTSENLISMHKLVMSLQLPSIQAGQSITSYLSTLCSDKNQEIIPFIYSAEQYLMIAEHNFKNPLKDQYACMRLFEACLYYCLGLLNSLIGTQNKTLVYVHPDKLLNFNPPKNWGNNKEVVNIISEKPLDNSTNKITISSKSILKTEKDKLQTTLFKLKRFICREKEQAVSFYNYLESILVTDEVPKIYQTQVENE